MSNADKWLLFLLILGVVAVLLVALDAWVDRRGEYRRNRRAAAHFQAGLALLDDRLGHTGTHSHVDGLPYVAAEDGTCQRVTHERGAA